MIMQFQAPHEPYEPLANSSNVFHPDLDPFYLSVY